MITYPNQKVITVNKAECKNNFLQLNRNAWQAAANTLSFSAFKIYLYMANNKNGYTFALSYAALNEEIPMKRDTYDNAIKDLKKAGYLEQEKGNQWNFYETV